MEQKTARAESPARTLTVLSPQWNGPITIAPLVRNRAPRAEYISLEASLAAGLELAEVDEEGIVGEIVARAETVVATLLVDGDELVGAKQDRILNVSVLLAGLSETRIPVSCVEQGRWRPRTMRFGPSRQTASPRLRKAKAEALAGAARQRSRAQGDVWSTVAAEMAHLDVASPTARHGDVVDAKRSEIAAVTAGFELVPGQCGAAVAIGGEVVAIDAVSRAEVFASLWPRLLAGYGLDALGAPEADRIPRRRFVRALAEVDRVPLARSPSVSLGEDLRGIERDIAVSGLALEGELIQLSALRSVV